MTSFAAVIPVPINTSRGTRCGYRATTCLATKLPNVILQVLPFRVGGHTAEAGAFNILRFPESDLPDVVYVEQLTSALYLDRRDDVDAYMEAMERLCVVSAPPDNTAEILSRILQET